MKTAWWIAMTMSLLAGPVFATGPLIVESGAAIDPQEIAKILKPPLLTRSIQMDTAPASVALRIPFALGSAKVPNASLPQLQAMSQAIKQSGAKVLIEGHTDVSGNPETNLRLSQRRAAAVRDVLVASYGVDRNELRVVGLGKSRPLPDVDPASSANRRVEFRADQ
jgi:outer membrane protein OmpA-like peptidoglycan-associated protein